jgi:phosphonate transport system ATP-binding protein
LTNTDAALVFRGVCKSYVAGKPVLNNITVEIAGTGITAIIGPSGTGKSTLVRCINGLVKPTSGEIIFRGQPLTGLKGRALRQSRARIGMVHQEYSLVERLSVMENVLSGRLGHISAWRAWLRRFPAHDIARAFELLDAVGLSTFAATRADQLSGGQRQRVGIARALMQNPEILLADEPTSSLDPKTSVEIIELMAKLAAVRGIPVLINIHNVELAKRFATRIIGMAGGCIVFDGPPSTLLDEHLATIYGGKGWIEEAA